ncbi:unnamed protein product [Dicrocoelium dendriticum]|nr:unnamed protein product [Dicrocoelium dendriticum]
MWIIPYVFLLISLGWTKATNNVLQYIVTFSVEFPDKGIFDLFPSEINLTFAISSSSHNYSLSFLLSCKAPLTSVVVVYRAEENGSYQESPLQCLCRPSFWSITSNGFRSSGHLSNTYRLLSLCENGLKVFFKMTVASFRGNYDKLIFRVNSLISQVNELFATFNIIIVVVRLEIWEQDRVRLNLEEHHLLPTLAQFKRMHAGVRHDCLHALLGEKAIFSLKRGSANARTMCVFSNCVGYSRDSASVDLMETARTMAHELGHNFGLRHDTEECSCQSCIMATGVEFGNNRMEWSPCSVRDLPVLLQYGMGFCLHDVPQNSAVSLPGAALQPMLTAASPVHRRAPNPPLAHSVVQVYDWQKEASAVSAIRAFRSNRALSAATGLCGNGVLDPGEECDCGTRLSCPQELQDCCDVTRCMLKSSSTCAGGPCCQVERRTDSSPSVHFHCRLADAGTICRNVTSTCDLPEYCDGLTQWCPPDVYKADGIACSTEEGSKSYCIRGGCRESDSWCRVLWGKTARIAHPSCFHENGRRHSDGKVDQVANCGKRRPPEGERWEGAKSWPPIECASWYDTECGRLWCHHRNEKALLLGVVQSQTRKLPSVRETCASVVYDPLWPAADPTTWATNNTRQLNWNAAAVGQLGAITQDAGMVPDGTPCSRGLCYNGSCLTLAELPTSQSCNCRGPGICNNLGHCHCSPGFHAPHCEHGGDGGSVDSGPPPREWRPHTAVDRRRYNLGAPSLLPPWAPPTWFFAHKSGSRFPPVTTTPTSKNSASTPQHSSYVPKYSKPTTRRPSGSRRRILPSKPKRPTTWPSRPGVPTTSSSPLGRAPITSSSSDQNDETTFGFTKPLDRLDNSKPALVIAVSLLIFLGIPLIVLIIYCAVRYRCRFTLTSAPMVPTKSGLRKPLDKGLLPFLRQCCRQSIPRSFTYDSLSIGLHSENFVSPEKHQRNGTTSVSNGLIHNHKPVHHEEASAKLGNGEQLVSWLSDILCLPSCAHLSDKVFMKFRGSGGILC